MTTIQNIYESLTTKLTEKYPTYGIYGQEIKDTYGKPSFVVSIYPKTISMENYNYKKYTYAISITYLQNEFNFMDNMQKIEELQQIFGMNLTVSDRILTVADYHFAYSGSNSNMLTLTFDLEFKQANEIVDEHKTMSVLNFNQNIK
ncbi:phage tail terminator family protein [Anaeromicropila herbilytica]|uniref:Phage protein n=1 Tax=Anaeromicropila herbilytica TaxID=2785025 RepID=A0A7R7EP60_9FIRM|nr:hypothetical protein [Anaeromicropila herbilytica]BCN32072.1 hypothetical protein bsdtb5_33670 [Anaeromicropila herbilytica]